MAPFKLFAASAGASLIPSDLPGILRGKGPFFLALGASTGNGMFGVPVRSYHIPPGPAPAWALAGYELEVLGEMVTLKPVRNIAKKEPQLS